MCKIDSLSSSSSNRKTGEIYEPVHFNPQQLVLNVAPLSCVPYISPTNLDDMFSSPTKEKTEAAETTGPAMIFLPSQSTREELDTVMATTKNGVVVTGAVATRTTGPIIGLVDIDELEDLYYFRVTFPGVSTEKKDFNCAFEPDGKVLIKGITTTGEKLVCKNFQIFHMLTQNLCRPGEFTVSFRLPGPLNHQQATSCLANGIA